MNEMTSAVWSGGEGCRGHVTKGAGANMNDMTSAVLCDKGVVGGMEGESSCQCLHYQP